MRTVEQFLGELEEELQYLMVKNVLKLSNTIEIRLILRWIMVILPKKY